MRLRIWTIPTTFSDVFDGLVNREAEDVGSLRTESNIRGTCHITDSKQPSGIGPSVLGEWNSQSQEEAVSAEALRLAIPSTNPVDIAAELDLGSAMPLEDLSQLRRTFAASNHPDKFPPELRQQATLRMQIANSLLDQHILLRAKR